MTGRLLQTCIAVVDDDESLCRSLARLLRASGMRVVIYASAEDFLADSQRPMFDCLVFDIQLGGMSGIELHRRLTASGSKTPVIYLTAHNEPAVRAEAKSSGCAGYLCKTDSGETVIKAIQQAANLLLKSTST